MALFGRKKAESKKTARIASVSTVSSVQRNISGVLIQPRITEKATNFIEQNVYTFIVRRDATKTDVRDAVRHLFNVTPRKIAIVNQAPRRSHARARGREVVVSGMKKAYVFLKKGEHIDLI